MDAMERLMQGRTTFMIAHRLTTLENCDMLVVLEEGQLIKMTSETSAAIKDATIMSGRTNVSIRGSKVSA
jgi:ABC-type bacteriocin/lantibiotic exporter with double-glycine peptidase domain